MSFPAPTLEDDPIVIPFDSAIETVFKSSETLESVFKCLRQSTAGELVINLVDAPDNQWHDVSPNSEAWRAYLEYVNMAHPNMVIKQANSFKATGTWSFFGKGSGTADRLYVFFYSRDYVQTMINEILDKIRQGCIAQLDFGCKLVLPAAQVDLDGLWKPAIRQHGYVIRSINYSSASETTTYHFAIPLAQIRARIAGKDLPANYQHQDSDDASVDQSDEE